MSLETETTIMMALIPFLAVWGLLRVAQAVERRRERCVSVTCSALVSSGGVRYPQLSAPSWRYVLPNVMASLAFISSRPR